MNFHPLKVIALLVWSCALASVAVGQAESHANSLAPVKTEASRSDERPAYELYEEANGYLGRKYAEFNKQKLNYDPQLEAKTKKEQKDLAIANAKILAARKDLKGEEIYYLGMLHHLADDSADALTAMRHFLADNKTGEKPQIARAVLVLHATRTNLIPEAEATVATYRKAEPLDLNEVFGMELLLTNAFSKAKDYERMAAHAAAMLEVARSKFDPKTVSSFKRDERLFKAASLLAEAQEKLNQPAAAIATMQNLIKLSATLPSGNLYKLARIRLAGLDPEADQLTLFDGETSSDKPSPPEIVAAMWIDQTPTTLSQLRGQVVLLDFWAHWCGPCQYVFPKLQRWHESYKDKGLVILGVTNYYGQTNGRPATAAEETAYLREFKKRNRLPYGFAIADSSSNDFNYGISSIPMSFLIDRSGNVRFIAVGANEQETNALGAARERPGHLPPSAQLVPRVQETPDRASAPGESSSFLGTA